MISNLFKTLTLAIVLLVFYAPLNEANAIVSPATIVCEFRCELELERNLATCIIGFGICRGSAEAVAAAGALRCVGSLAAIAFCLNGVVSRRSSQISACQTTKMDCNSSAGSRFRNCKRICSLNPFGSSPR